MRIEGICADGSDGPGDLRQRLILHVEQCEDLGLPGRELTQGLPHRLVGDHGVGDLVTSLVNPFEGAAFRVERLRAHL